MGDNRHANLTLNKSVTSLITISTVFVLFPKTNGTIINQDLTFQYKYEDNVHCNPIVDQSTEFNSEVIPESGLFLVLWLILSLWWFRAFRKYTLNILHHFLISLVIVNFVREIFTFTFTTYQLGEIELFNSISFLVTESILFILIGLLSNGWELTQKRLSTNDRTTIGIVLLFNCTIFINTMIDTNIILTCSSFILLYCFMVTVIYSNSYRTNQLIAQCKQLIFNDRSFQMGATPLLVNSLRKKEFLMTRIRQKTLIYCSIMGLLHVFCVITPSSHDIINFFIKIVIFMFYVYIISLLHPKQIDLFVNNFRSSRCDSVSSVSKQPTAETFVAPLMIKVSKFPK